jgi:hypothetical protein
MRGVKVEAIGQGYWLWALVLGSRTELRVRLEARTGGL